MSYNDMEVIMYKILKYLYECMKNGAVPREEDFTYSSKLLRIPQRYWNQIIEEMLDEGLVKGFFVTETKDGKLIQTTDASRITFKGEQFLQENDSMKSVKEFLGKAFDDVVQGLIQAIITSTFR